MGFRSTQHIAPFPRPEDRNLVEVLELALLRRLLALGRGRVSGLVLDGVEVVDEVGYVVVIVVLSAAGWWPLLALLDRLVGLGELAEGRERVGAELVEDTGYEFGQLLVLAVAVDGKGVGRDGSVD